MTLLEQMRQVAAAENQLARANWDIEEFEKPSRAELVRPYVGSGLKQTEVARRIGISQQGVAYILNKNGWTL